MVFVGLLDAFFKEQYLNEAAILQEFYDVTKDEASRENALLVFNQVFTASTGVSIAINSEPFEIVAAMSGEVTEVKMDSWWRQGKPCVHSRK